MCEARRVLGVQGQGVGLQAEEGHQVPRRLPVHRTRRGVFVQPHQDGQEEPAAEATARPGGDADHRRPHPRPGDQETQHRAARQTSEPLHHEQGGRRQIREGRGQACHRHRSVQVRELQARRRPGAGAQRRLLGLPQAADQDHGMAQGDGGGRKGRGPGVRAGGRHQRRPGPRGGAAEAEPQAQHQVGARIAHLLPGPQPRVQALGQQARAAGSQLFRGRLLHRQEHLRRSRLCGRRGGRAAVHRLRPQRQALSLRPEEGPRTAGQGRLPGRRFGESSTTRRDATPRTPRWYKPSPPR